jgi:hypothetical protein
MDHLDHQSKRAGAAELQYLMSVVVCRNKYYYNLLGERL